MTCRRLFIGKLGTLLNELRPKDFLPWPWWYSRDPFQAFAVTFFPVSAVFLGLTQHLTIFRFYFGWMRGDVLQRGLKLRFR